MAGPFGWNALTVRDALRVRDRLRALESMTWQEILNAPHCPNHPIAIDALKSPARVRLRELRADDVEEVISLHVTGRQRILGLRHTHGTLALLWWDPNHSVA